MPWGALRLAANVNNVYYGLPVLGVTPALESFYCEVGASHNVFQSQCHSHAAAHAQRGHASLGIALQHLVQQGHRDARASTPKGMTERDRPAIYIQPIA